MDHDRLVDDIYEAAILPDLWLRTLDQVTTLAGAEGAMLFANRQDNVSYINTPALDAIMRAWVEEGWVARNDRGQRLIPIVEPRFFTDLDVFTREELDRSPFYAEFLRGRGLGWCAGTSIHAPTSDTIVLSIERRFDRGPVEAEAVRRLDLLRPHIARAAMLSARVGLERAKASVIALEQIGLPAAAITSTRRVLAANALFDSLAPAAAIGAGDRLAFENRDIHALVSAAMRGGSARAAQGLSFPLPAKDERAPAVGHLVPLTGAGRDVFVGATYLLYVTPLSVNAIVPAPILQALFDLTATEARVAILIGEGKSAATIARRLGVQPNTVRVHLRSVFAKTGARRQADIVRLVAMPAGASPAS